MLKSGLTFLFSALCLVLFAKFNPVTADKVSSYTACSSFQAANADLQNINPATANTTTSEDSFCNEENEEDEGSENTSHQQHHELDSCWVIHHTAPLLNIQYQHATTAVAPVRQSDDLYLLFRVFRI